MQGNNENMERLYQLIGRELDGSISDLEKSELNALLNNSAEYKKIYQQTSKLWNQPLTEDLEQSTVDDFQLEVNVDNAWNRMNDRMLMDKINENYAKIESETIEPDKEDHHNQSNHSDGPVFSASPGGKATGSDTTNRHNTEDDSKSRRLPRSFGNTAKYGIAATLAFGLALLLFFQFDDSANNTVLLSRSAGAGETNRVQLSDCTWVELNENSNIRFPEVFEGKTREVDLKGEAFFDVARNEAKPFIIHSGNVDVQVLGTSFQVSIEKNKNVNVQVVSGKVQVSSSADPNVNVILEKGDATSFDINKGAFETVEANTNDLYWRTKTLIFKNTALSEVVAVLKENYNANITFTNDNPKNCRLTTTFKNQTLEEVMEIIDVTLEEVEIRSAESGNAYEISSETGCP